MVDDEQVCLNCIAGRLLDMASAYTRCIDGDRDGCAKYAPARQIVEREVRYFLPPFSEHADGERRGPAPI